MQEQVHADEAAAACLQAKGCALAEAGDFHGAVLWFQRATAAGPVGAEVYEMLAQCLLETEAAADAAAAASSAVSLKPQVVTCCLASSAFLLACAHLLRCRALCSGGALTSLWRGPS